MREEERKSSCVLDRFEGNPILEPRPEHWWESKAVFNPSAIYETGRVHIVYRAIGDADISVFGYASSVDGFYIDERLPEPIYVPREPFEGSGLLSSMPSYHQRTYMPTEDESYESYVSGGGWGGCEDPRLTRIKDRVFMTYVAFDGYSPPRVALTSIHIDDFLNKNWQWKKPVLISLPGVIDKNACILPEKINSKYVIFHRVFPDILVDFVDDLDFDGTTRWLKGQFKIQPRASYWDSRKIGAGAPPIKTADGWLLIYHGVDERDAGRYKIGAMLLDLKNPSKVLSRIEKPILEPQAWYENEGWKSGVIYPCGAVVVKDHLLVYYGGADKVVCVASTKLDKLLDQLIDRGEALQAPVYALPAEAGVALVIPIQKRIRAYCMRCRAKREMRNPITMILKNGRRAVQGTCSKCSAKMSQIMKAGRE
jgi:beta-1,2-mannobiose phosphorylase / 1,2-beta-oligomannan phosphorylase